MRRTAIFFCLGVAIFAAILPCAMVSPPALLDRVAGLNTQTATCSIETDRVCSPLLVCITPRHLARASLDSFAA